MKYNVIIQTTHTEYYEIEASSQEEAESLTLEGKANLEDVTMDNTITTERVIARIVS